MLKSSLLSTGKILIFSLVIFLSSPAEGKIAFAGDLRYGRTVHSLAYALSLYDVELYLISPESLKMRREVLQMIKDKIPVTERTGLEKIVPLVDVCMSPVSRRNAFLTWAPITMLRRATGSPQRRSRE
jgi:hypothetical protein